MRLGLELSSPVPGGNGSLGATIEEATAAEELGFDLLWIDGPASMAVAAALAPHLRSIAVGAVVAVGVDHPLYSVEEAAVTDQLLGGRLVTCLRPAPGAEAAERFTEAVDLFLAGFAPRPFRHHGPTWRVPANLPDNVFNTEERLRVTPAPAHIEPPVWITGGPGAAAVTASHTLAYVADDPADGLTTWPGIAAALGVRALRLRRPARWPVEASAGEVDVHRLSDDLSEAQRSWGLDTAILVPSPDDRPDRTDRTALLGRIAHDVRPRVQLDRLPPGLSDYWDGRMAARLSGSTTARGGDDG